MNKCTLCKSSNIDNIKYGNFITKYKISVHYFCLLLTSNLVQNGSDNQGILGFLIVDIQKEAERIRDQICFYCGLSSAGIGCCDYRCRRTFHLICGIENGALNQFSETFRSFCNIHIPKMFRNKLPVNTKCSICYDIINVKHKHTMCCKAPCCKNGWFHKYCLQQFANNSGYFFKCPLCNNSDQFRDILVHRGIFIPDQDASWELEPNAFSELLERPNECSALECLCSKGRKHNDSNEYEIIFCYTCGSQGIHVFCRSDNDREFNCVDCSKIFSERNKNVEFQINDSSTKRVLKGHSNENDFIVVDDIENGNNEITAAEVLRQSLTNHSLTKKFTDDFEINSTNIKNLNKNNSESFEEFDEKSTDIYLQPKQRNRIISDSEDDEIFQLTCKKRKIYTDSDETFGNESNNQIVTRSYSRCHSSDDINFVMTNRNNKFRILDSPLYKSNIRTHRFKKSLKTPQASSDDDMPLTLLTNKDSFKCEKTENKNINKIITRSNSRSQSVDDIDFVIKINKDPNTKIKNNNQNSHILQSKNRTRQNIKEVVKSSEDDVPLKFLRNNNSKQLPNSTILNNQNTDIKKEQNSIILTNRKSRIRTRLLNNEVPIKKKYITRSNSTASLPLFTRTLSINKTGTSVSPKKRLLSRHKFELVRYERENSESSLSSADINLKKRNTSVLKDNAKNKQTPINRNIPSTSSNTRLKTKCINLKSNKNSLSSSSASASTLIFDSVIKSNSKSTLQNNKFKKRLMSPESKYSTIYQNSNNTNLILNKSIKTQLETSSNSDSSSSNFVSQRLYIDSDSDSDDFVSKVIKNINTQSKNIANKSEKYINNKNNGKCQCNDIQRYLSPNKFYKNQLHF